MRRWPRRASALKPQTLIGQWLRAAVLGQPELRDQLRLKLNGGEDGWNSDEPAVVEATCVLALRKLFPTGIDERAIKTFVSELFTRIHDTTMPGQEATEALIRAALRDQDVAIGGLRRRQVSHAHGTLVFAVWLKLGLDEAARDQLIVGGERIALERGWHPPLS